MNTSQEWRLVKLFEDEDGGDVNMSAIAKLTQAVQELQGSSMHVDAEIVAKPQQPFMRVIEDLVGRLGPAGALAALVATAAHLMKDVGGADLAMGRQFGASELKRSLTKNPFYRAGGGPSDPGPDADADTEV